MERKGARESAKNNCVDPAWNFFRQTIKIQFPGMALWTRRIAMKLRGKAVFLFLVEISCDETFRSLLYETTEEPL